MSILSKLQALLTAANTKTGESDTTLTDAMQTLVDGYGQSGGGGGISLLSEITLQSDTREYNLDLSSYQNYNFFFVYLDVELTTSDWIYYVRNGSSATGGNYDAQDTIHQGICAFQFKPLIANTNVCSGIVHQASFNVSSSVAITNLYIYAYTATRYMKVGSKIKIFGGNYTDL